MNYKNAKISKKEYSETTYFKNGYSQIKIRQED
jgi:hypothetical protein